MTAPETVIRQTLHRTYWTSRMSRGQYDDALAALAALVRERDALAEALREAYPYVNGVASDASNAPWRVETATAILARIDAALAASGSAAEARVTHGRHCSCTACANEDWTRITGPCGMHGADCPAVYAPAEENTG